MNKKLILGAFVLAGFSKTEFALSAETTAIDGIVYVLAGGPVDLGNNPNGVYERYLKMVKDLMPAKNLFLKKIHNSNQGQACQDIKDQKQVSPNAVLVLSGHSYGSDAAIWVARCLEQSKIAVDLLLTADTIARNGLTVVESLTPPENVKVNFHYYQQTDPMLPGSGFNKRADGSFRNIYNFKFDMGASPVQSHLNGFKNLIDYKIHPTLALLGLMGVSETEMSKELRPLNEALFKDHPQVPIETN